MSKQAKARRRVVQTVGGSRLWDWLEVKGNSQKALADRLRVSQPCIAQWKSGHSRPTHEYRVAIERELGIPSVEWMTAEEKSAAFTPVETVVAVDTQKAG